MKTNINQEHHYALSKDGVLTHIKDAYNSVEDFFCPHCKCRMIKKCGQIRQWHFAHDWRIADEQQKQCTYETYLHSYAKMRLEQWFKESDSIIIRYKTSFKCNKYNTCKLKAKDRCRSILKDTVNIKDYLNKCEVEKDITIDNQLFRPDLIWYNEKKKIEEGIFIEVKVTHGCTETKKNSSVRIIEFEIESEDDVDKIISNEIAENEYTHFYGFRIKTSKNTLDISPCSLELSLYPILKKFILYKNGKGFIRNVSGQDYHNRDSQSCFEMTVSSDRYIDNESFFRNGFLVAKAYGLDINTCLFCKHHYSIDTFINICQKHNKGVSYYNYTYDSFCDDFECIDINDSEYYNSSKAYNIIDIWPERIKKEREH